MGGNSSPRVIEPLAGDELQLWLAGLEDFDAGRYWHAHEDWEDLWNAHKRRSAAPEEILFVQGMIQTAALLLNHERKKVRGVNNLTVKVNTKLANWTCVWGIDIEHHVASMNDFGADAGVWSMDPQAYVLKRCERELEA